MCLKKFLNWNNFFMDQIKSFVYKMVIRWFQTIHEYEKKGVLYAPGKAANAGGVATSGLEMSQNSIRLSWSREEVEEKLQHIMQKIHKQCIKHGKNSFKMYKQALVSSWGQVYFYFTFFIKNFLTLRLDFDWIFCQI